MRSSEFIFTVADARVRVLPQVALEQAADTSDVVVFLYAEGALSHYLNREEVSRLGIREAELQRIIDSVMEIDALEELLRLRDLKQLCNKERDGVKHAIATQLEAASSENLPLYSAFTEAIAKAVLLSYLLRQILPMR